MLHKQFINEGYSKVLPTPVLFKFSFYKFRFKTVTKYVSHVALACLQSDMKEQGGRAYQQGFSYRREAVEK